MKRDRCPTCHAEAGDPCRRLVVDGRSVRWEDLPGHHRDRRTQ